MQTKIKPKKCQNPDCDKTFTPRKSFDKYCSWPCAKPFVKPLERKPIERKMDNCDQHKKPRKRIQRIKPISNKQKQLLAKYHKIRVDFLNKPENKICPVVLEDREGEKRSTTEIHHKKGRQGFADDWAREHDIPLLIDKRFFLAVSRDGHRWIEENPVKAKEKGFSVDRLSNG